MTGYYGENCSLPCPKNCQGRLCDIVEGKCLGYVVGYTGRTSGYGKLNKLNTTCHQ